MGNKGPVKVVCSLCLLHIYKCTSDQILSQKQTVCASEGAVCAGSICFAIQRAGDIEGLTQSSNDADKHVHLCRLSASLLFATPNKYEDLLQSE